MRQRIDFRRLCGRDGVLARLGRCGFLIRLGLCVPFLALGAANVPLTLQISNELAPPGGTVQFKVSASVPALIAAGNLSMDFDASIFGPVAQLAVFSATGDQIGYANVNAEHLDVHFSSPSAGIGQLPSLPVFTASIPVLASASPGATASVAATSLTGWTDPLGNPYTVSATPGTFTVGGTLSVQSVTPGGGLLPARTVLQLSGTGFDAGTSVAIDGVSLSAVDFFNAEQINLTLGGATEMTGKHVRVSNSAGAQVEYYVALPSAPVDPPPADSYFAGVHAILPLTTYTGAEVYAFGDAAEVESLAMFNPDPAPVTVTLAGFQPIASSTQLISVNSYLLPPGQLSLIDITQPLNSLGLGFAWVTTSAPVRFINVIGIGLAPVLSTIVSTPPPITIPEPPIEIQLTPYPYSGAWSWQTGSPAPAPETVTFAQNFSFSVSVSASAAEWLSVSSVSHGSYSTLTLTPNPVGLKPGTYSGTVTVTPVAPASLSGVPVIPTVINVTLTATGAAVISALVGQCCGFSEPGNQYAEILPIVSNGGATPVEISASTSSGGNWLRVSVRRGTTPIQLSVADDTLGLNLAPGNYSGQITIQGPANTVNVAVLLTVNAQGPPPPNTLMINAPPPAFTLPAGTPQSNSFSSFLSFQQFNVELTSVTSNVSWLNVAVQSLGPLSQVNLYPNSVGLAPGVYQGAITINAVGYPTLVVPATLAVLANPTAQTMLTATPAALSYTAPAGGSAAQNLSIAFNGPPVDFKTTIGAGWLELFPAAGSTSATPIFSLTAFATGLAPGTYYTGLVIAWTTGQFTVPVTFSVTATPGDPPILTAVVNSASETPGPIAPGEFIAILGSGLGATPAVAALDASGDFGTDIGETEVLIGGIKAPLIYASASQVNALVPFDVETSGTVSVQVVSIAGRNRANSGTWDVPLASAAPAIFTAGSTGVGQAAVLNQDSSVNSASNPAARGSTIQIFGTGGGQTMPASVSGALAPPGETLEQSVQVTIGGVNAVVSYAGAAPGEVNGLVQINAAVPQSVTPGPSLPIALKIASISSPTGPTIAVQ
jgi:uncharacterized protein (TIGR03437 family)